MPDTVRSRLVGAFRWFGVGAGVLAITLFGRVSADQVVGTPSGKLLFLGLGALGTVFVLIGMVVLFMGARGLREGE